MTIVNNFQKESKSRKVIAENTSYSQSFVSKDINGKLTGREKCAQAAEMTCSLERIIKKVSF